jgi:hypothetical protein
MRPHTFAFPVAPARCVSLLSALALAIHAPAALAQADSAPRAGATARPMAGPPVRRIATATAVSTEPLGAITGVRELPDGRVLLNDGTRRRLLLMDTTLRAVGVVLDSLAEIENTYGTRAGTLVPYRGDSTLFIDPASFAMLVLDPAGRVARVRSVPRTQDVQWLTSSGFYGWPGADARGRLVHRLPARPAPPRVAPPRGMPYFPQEPDSAFIVAMDPDTRTQDTLGAVRIPKSVYKFRMLPDGGFNVNSVENPMPTSDGWAVLSDGTVAFVRVLDYRVEYLGPDGTLTSSPKLPFDWQRVTEADKQHIVDSVKAIQQRSALTSYATAMIRWVNTYKKPYPADFTLPAGYRLQFGLARDWKLPPGVTIPERYVYACARGEEPTIVPPPAAAAATPGAPAAVAPPTAATPAAVPAGAAGPPGAPPAGTPSCIPAPNSMFGGGGGTPPPPTPREALVVDPSDLPDYRPPIGQGAVRADADGNLWIRTNPARPVPGGPVYDVVSRSGELTDRLQLPPGYTLVGFGRGRVVYLSMRDQGGIRLARVRLR